QSPRRLLRALTIGAIVVAVLSVGNLAFGSSSRDKFLNVAGRAIADRLPRRFATIPPLQQRNGSFRGVFSPQDSADIWTSAQVLTAVLSDPSHRAESKFRAGQLWNVFQFFKDVSSAAYGGGWGHSISHPTTEMTAWVTVAETAALKRKPAK